MSDIRSNSGSSAREPNRPWRLSISALCVAFCGEGKITQETAVSSQDLVIANLPGQVILRCYQRRRATLILLQSIVSSNNGFLLLFEYSSRRTIGTENAILLHRGIWWSRRHTCYYMLLHVTTCYYMLLHATTVCTVILITSHPNTRESQREPGREPGPSRV